MKDPAQIAKQLSKDPSFNRWIKGEGNQAETKKWNRWVQKSERHRRIAKQAQQLAAGLDFKEPELPDIQKEWKRVRSDILGNHQNKRKNADMKRYSWDITASIFKAAAVLAVVVFAGYASYLYQGSAQAEEKAATSTIKTVYGQKKTINLPDGSKIILGAHSQLTYKDDWLDQPLKKISLEGEAFFDIAPKKKDRPKLVVQTHGGTVSVWGTRFTVNTHNSRTQVVLDEGEVKIETRHKDAEATLKPGEQAIFKNGSSGIVLKEVNPKVYTSWFTRNELVFDDTPLSVLISRLEQNFGLETEVEDSTILQKRLSGSVEFQELDSLTAAVSKLLDIQMKRNGDTLIIN